MKRFYGIIIGLAWMFAFTRCAAQSTITLTSSVSGSSSPSISARDTSQNGDFTIIGLPGGGSGDGVDEETYWRFTFTPPPDVASRSVVSAVLTLTLTAENPAVSDDDVRIAHCGCASVPVGSHPLGQISTFTTDLLGTYSSQFLIDSLRVHGSITMGYEDDAIISHATLQVTLSPARLSILKPAPGQRWVVGTEDTIRWTGHTTHASDLFVSGDDGLTYQSLDVLLPPSDTIFLWTPPENLTTGSRYHIKVEDAVDASISAETGRITIRSYQLAKVLPDGSYRLFKPSVDGWRFPNDTSHMWPTSWWSQFDYTRIIDPHTQNQYPCTLISAVQICHVAPKKFPDWPLFVDAFKVGRCYQTGLFSNELTYRPRSLALWNVLASARFGSCSGMATGSMLYFMDGSSLRAKFPHLSSFVFAHDATLDDSLRKALNELQQYQNGTVQSQNDAAGQSITPMQTLANIRSMLLSDSPSDDATLALVSNNNSSAHEVIPFGLGRDQFVPGRIDVFVYDPNNPGRDDVFIEIDSTTNTWIDQLPRLNFGSGATGCYLDVPAAFNLAHPTLPPTAAPGMVPRTGGQKAIAEEERVYVPVTCDAGIRSDHGDSAGIRDSISFNTIPGSGLLIPRIGGYSPPIGYDLPVGSYTMTLDRFTDPEAAATLFRGGNVYRYDREDADSGQSDGVALNGGMLISNPDAVTKEATLTAISGSGNASTVVVLDGVGLALHDSVDLEQQSPSVLKVRNYGNAKEYDLVIGLTDTNGLRGFEHAHVALSALSTQQIIIPEESVATVRILIDRGSDGTIDDTISLDNQVTSVVDRTTGPLPGNWSLGQSYPNPFNPSATIRFGLPADARVTLSICNILGESVATLVDGVLSAGERSVTWDAAGVPSGVYFYRIEMRPVDGGSPFSSVKKMLLLR